MPPSPSNPKVQSLTWVYISAGAFVVALAAIGLFLLKAPGFRLPNGMFFVILVPLGLAAAAFLFGAMRSHATWKGTTPNGTLELGGPVVVLCLVVLAGMRANTAETFSLTVRVHGPGGPSAVVREGTVTADLAGVRRTASIGSTGEVTFAEVPAELEGTAIRVFATAPGLVGDSTADKPVSIPATHVIELGLVAQVFKTTVRGTVKDARGKVVRGAAVNVGAGAATASTDDAGNFSVTLTSPPGTVLPITVAVQGTVLFDNSFTVAADPPLSITLSRGAR